MNRQERITEFRAIYKESLVLCRIMMRLGHWHAARRFAWRADYAYKAFQQAIERGK